MSTKYQCDNCRKTTSTDPASIVDWLFLGWADSDQQACSVACAHKILDQMEADFIETTNQSSLVIPQPIQVVWEGASFEEETSTIREWINRGAVDGNRLASELRKWADWSGK